MNAQVLALQMAAATCYSIAGGFMKASEGLTRVGPSLIVYTLFIIGVSLQMISMRHTAMGSAYIVVLGLEAVVALAVSRLWFREHLGLRQAIAVLLVMGGVALLRREG